MKTLNVSAGGRGERISSYTASIQPFLPKHLLPVPTKGKTILGEIVLRAKEYFKEIRIWSSGENHQQIATAVEELPIVNVEVDTDMTGPLGPMVRNLLTSRSRTFGCAGDFYCDFLWSEFERFHDSHGLPISILTAKSVAAPKGARFFLKDSIIFVWERVESTTEEDRINIGCYIIDPVPEVMYQLQSLTKHKEDPFFDIFVPKGMMAGYDPVIPGFNINIAEVYKSLLRTLSA